MSSAVSTAPSRAPWLAWLYAGNPFYAISAVLMLYGIRSAYAEAEIGLINSWIMMGVLAGYTLVLAGIAVSIIRWGHVWDDARSLLVLLLLLFLAISISLDDLLNNADSIPAATAFMLFGFIGSTLVSEMVLRGARIRLGFGYRAPFYLLLALFYVFPWMCSPVLRPQSAATLEWLIFLFPTLAAGLFLLLLPAVRRGSAYAANNGTPWLWPWFPWTIFAVLAAAVGLRSFVLAMTYGPEGAIWSGPGFKSINFETIFGPYFLIPLAFALLSLMLEGAVIGRNQILQRRILLGAPLLLLLAVPYSQSLVFQNFLHRVMELCGSPLWITVLLLLILYGRAWLAGVPQAGLAWLGTLLLFSAIGPETVRLESPVVLQSWPVFIVGAVAAVHGIQRRSSGYSLLGAALISCGVWLVLPQTIAANFRMTLCYHILWLTVITIGIACRDRLATLLRIVGAAQVPIAALVALVALRDDFVPISWRLLYVLVVATTALALGALWRQRWYLYAFAGTLAMGMYAGMTIGFQHAVAMLGRPAMMALSWSFAALLIGFLISASKARWLPWHLAAPWFPKFSRTGATPEELS